MGDLVLFMQNIYEKGETAGFCVNYLTLRFMLLCGKLLMFENITRNVSKINKKTNV